MDADVVRQRMTRCQHCEEFATDGKFGWCALMGGHPSRCGADCDQPDVAHSEWMRAVCHAGPDACKRGYWLEDGHYRDQSEAIPLKVVRDE